MRWFRMEGFRATLNAGLRTNVKDDGNTSRLLLSELCTVFSHKVQLPFL